LFSKHWKERQQRGHLSVFCFLIYDGHSDADSHLTTPYDCVQDVYERYDRIDHETMDLWFTVYVLSYEEFLMGMKHLGRWKPMAAD